MGDFIRWRPFQAMSAIFVVSTALAVIKIAPDVLSRVGIVAAFATVYLGAYYRRARAAGGADADAQRRRGVLWGAAVGLLIIAPVLVAIVE
jgi:hypothetical protein